MTGKRSPFPMLLFFPALVIVAGSGLACETPPHEPGCDTLRFMARGEVLGEYVDLQKVELRGEMSEERIVVSIDAPDGAGEWFLDFGYNSRNLDPVSEREDLVFVLNEYQTRNGDTLLAVHKPEDEDCDIDEGEICGGLGINENGQGEYDVWLSSINYLPAHDGWVRLNRIDGNRVELEFSLDFLLQNNHGEEVHGEGAAGSLQGCISARRVFRTDPNSTGYLLQ